MGLFSFGIVQSEDHFDFYASIDHVHGDAALIGITMLEGARYVHVAEGDRPADAATGRWEFDDFCLQERGATAGLTADSPEVREWIEFAENSGGTGGIPCRWATRWSPRSPR